MDTRDLVTVVMVSLGFVGCGSDEPLTGTRWASLAAAQHCDALERCGCTFGGCEAALEPAFARIATDPRVEFLSEPADAYLREQAAAGDSCQYPLTPLPVRGLVAEGGACGGLNESYVCQPGLGCDGDPTTSTPFRCVVLTEPIGPAAPLCAP
ncbi:hypothetical protein [Sandaracinus amylolyticus]|uniref:hypothetical protein n=1 Tax=Sandaracinus amylolyticus TaxID=927083 RepID=UPI001F2207F0|nr:hypothetical protein [Sandaracinus amylolyticus]UJR83638.1 Hypothetical protein I5071_57070 [Sandaracinus amylolyticus]